MADPAWVRRLVAAVLGDLPAAVEPLTGSVENASFLVHLPGRLVVLKTCAERARLAEMHALTLAVEHGVPVPALLATGRDDEPWIMIEHCSGQPAYHDPAALAAAGRALGRAHAIVLHGFGHLDASGQRQHTTWTDAFLAGLDDELRDTIHAGLLSPSQADQVHTAVTSPPPHEGSPRLLHGDLKNVHILAVKGQLSALIDWGDSHAGDPAYDLARYSLEGDDNMRDLMTGYGAQPLQVDRMRAYRLRFTSNCLATELRAGGDWFAVYKQRIVDDLR